MGGSPPDAKDLPPPTPEEVRTATFSQSQLAWRGYSEDEVRAFLNRVADSMAAADLERAGLRSEVDRLRNFYRDHGHDVDLASNGKARIRTAAAAAEEDGLLKRIRAYVEVQVRWAMEYAGFVDTREKDRADAAFNHARVQTALAVEEFIRRSIIYMYEYATPNPIEVDRASLWLRAFFHAFHAQLQATNDALKKAVNKPLTQGSG